MAAPRCNDFTLLRGSKRYAATRARARPVFLIVDSPGLSEIVGDSRVDRCIAIVMHRLHAVSLHHHVRLRTDAAVQPGYDECGITNCGCTMERVTCECGGGVIVQRDRLRPALAAVDGTAEAEVAGREAAARHNDVTRPDEGKRTFAHDEPR